MRGVFFRRVAISRLVSHSPRSGFALPSRAAWAYTVVMPNDNMHGFLQNNNSFPLKWWGGGGGGDGEGAPNLALLVGIVPAIPLSHRNLLRTLPFCKGPHKT